MAGSIVALIASIYISNYVRIFHAYRFTFGLVVSEIIVLTAFAISESPLLIGPLFIIHFTLQTLLYICLNIFIESFSKHTETGSIRGLFLVLLNSSILISPIIAGAVLTKSSFEVLYILASVMLIPFLFLLRKFLSHVKEPRYHKINMFEALQKSWRNKNLRGILIAGFIIECFYAVMVIYSPLYLQTLGIPLTTYLSVILPFALIPLVVLPYEFGILADRKYGEKELLISGLLLLAFTVFLCVIVRSSDPYVWIGIFLLSRIGAACVETMAFTYYYKKVGPEDSSLVALFSSTRPLATIIVGATGIAIAPLVVERPQLMFVILGCAILWSISYILPIKDTR